MQTKTYSYFQPEYVKNFKCDGQACGAHCCRRWNIEIDKKTFKKYSHVKPKSAAHEIVKHIKKGTIDNKERYLVQLDKTASCPFLTEDNWCHIQKKYGEEFLSETCVTYPRRTYSFKNFYERALTMTCPVVAATVLVFSEPIKFEHIEVPEIIHNNLNRITSPFSPVPVELWQYIIKIQSAAISILQRRELSIDHRLIVLGFFLDRLDEMIDNNGLEEIDKLTEIYTSDDFIKEYAPIFAQKVNFNAKEFVKIILGTFEALYGGESDFRRKDRRFIDSVVEALQIRVDANNQVAVDEIAQNYLELSKFRKVFVEQYATVFENFLVNEFFLNQYPWKFKGSITYNFGVFVTIYKMLETIAMSKTIQNLKQSKQPPMNKIELTTEIILFVNNVDHNNSYVNKISEQLSGKDNTALLIQSLLQS